MNLVRLVAWFADPTHSQTLAALAQPLASRAVLLDADCRRQQLVRAHADQSLETVDRDVVAGLAQDVGPGAGVRRVAVDESAIDVQDHAAGAAGHARQVANHGPDRPARLSTRCG